ncbi:MAG TPA: Lrp/AsnC family transcriptional regulator [Sphingobium sp.]|uniref:Lrp/AsnC family transcriptional regulator n=1 Tax=Sphingobium sp. TaxID=1912891 RepID=UPI002ED20CD0
MADEADHRILKVLARNGRISNTDLADAVGLSPSPCLRRVRRLEEAGIIQGYSVRVDPAIEGWTMASLVMIRLSRQHEDEIQMFEDAIRSWDEVTECHLVTGTPDYVLKVRSRSLEDYERFIKRKVARLKCVGSIETNVIMSSVK